MGQLFAEISARIPANKFYPPRFAAGQNIFRPRLVLSSLANKGQSKKVFLIEAQAGQGKTTLAAQYLQHTGATHVWYQVGVEDRDPVLLLTAMLASLKRALPAFASPQLEKMLADGEVSVLELRGAVNMMLADLDAFLDRDFFIVFDDFHLLEGFEQSLSVIDYAIETSPPDLRFMLISRWGVSLQARALKFNRESLRLTNQDIAMSEEESAALLQSLLDGPLPAKTVRELLRATDGWTMGLILAGHAIGRAGALGQLKEVEDSIQQGQIPEYFKEEIFFHLPQEWQEPLLKLSFLDEIPIALAQQITGSVEVARQLEKLIEQNYFVRSLNEENTLFSFHHLFQEFLQERAQQEMGRATIDNLLHQAATFWMEQKRPQKAMLYYLRAEDYDSLVQMLAEEGMALVAMNRLGTLSEVLRAVPMEVIKKSGWFSYFFGIVTELNDPRASLPFFETARINFIKEEALVGELLASAQIINFYMAYDGSYNKGAAVLRRAEELFQHHAGQLDTFTKILVAHDVASGFCFFEMDMEKAHHYSAYGLELAQRHDLDNFVGRIRIIQGFEHLLQGRYDKSLEIAEAAYPLIWSPRVDMVSRIGLRTLLLDLLEKAGDFDSFAVFEQDSFAAPEGKLISGTITAPLLMVWKADAAIAQGQLEKAETILGHGLQQSFYGHAPHLRSQFLHYLAYLHALEGRKSEAIDALEESRPLRAEVGGPYYVVLNNLMAGATYARLGMTEQAETYLARTIQGAEEIGVEYFRGCAHLYGAYLHLRARRQKRAIRCLADGLAIMRRCGYRHFHGWQPEMMRDLLALAVAQDIEKEYALELAADRLGLAVADEGTIFPLLRIRMLGGFELGFDEKSMVCAQDLTPGQRQLLAMLVCAPRRQIRQEHVQVAMWPDSASDKARSKFDSSLSRLRKSLGDTLGEEAVKRCLVLKKGILCLENCRIDGLDFLAHVREGMRQHKAGNCWQAGVAFEKALVLWQGCAIGAYADTQQVNDFCFSLVQSATEISLNWARKLREMGRTAKAISLLHRTLQYDPTNEELVRLLYRFYGDTRETKKAQDLLKQFAGALRKEEYTPEEIEEFLADVCQESDSLRR